MRPCLRENYFHAKIELKLELGFTITGALQSSMSPQVRSAKVTKALSIKITKLFTTLNEQIREYGTTEEYKTV